MKKQFKDNSKRILMNNMRANSLLNDLKDMGLNEIMEVTEGGDHGIIGDGIIDDENTMIGDELSPENIARFMDGDSNELE